MYIKVNNTRLFFDIYGSALDIKPNKVTTKPTLIVLHGGHGIVDHTLYVEFWSQLSAIAQVIFLDQRSVGRSDEVDLAECNLQNWGQDVVDFCAALGVKKPIIAGVSMGGHIMGELVAKHPQFPGGLIFCNTEAKFDLDAMVEMFAELIPNAIYFTS